MGKKVLTNGHDPFAAFKMPPSVTQGVEIALGNTGAVFTVLLPSSVNEAFQAHFISNVPRVKTEDKDALSGEDVAQVHRVRRDAFVATCLVSAKGLPDGMDPPAFFDAYPLALLEVFNQAEEMARADDAAFKDALGN